MDSVDSSYILRRTTRAYCEHTDVYKHRKRSGRPSDLVVTTSREWDFGGGSVLRWPYVFYCVHFILSENFPIKKIASASDARGRVSLDHLSLQDNQKS